MAFAGLSLDNKVIVVIGGTSGIGRALALGLAEAGAIVIPTSRRQEQVDETAREVESRGARTLRVTSDVTDRPSLEKLLAESVAAFGQVHGMINCAGRIKRVPTLELSEEDWNAIIETNLTGSLRACQVFGKHMVDKGYGRIVNIVSLNSFVALKEVAAYGASKSGVTALTRHLAVELGPLGVTVNAIAPGVFRTPLNQNLLDGTDRGRELLMRTPMKRFGKLEELVGAAIFLCSDSASFVNGQTIAVDGGFLASGVNQ